MKLMKKSMAAILALTMCLSLLPVNVFAAAIQDGHEHNTGGYVCTPHEGHGELLCPVQEHTHTPDCYGPAEGPTLICGQAENPGHAHSDVCYGGEGELVCTLAEQEGHTHSDVCYYLYCTIPEHIHGVDCDGFCDMEQHTHVWPACYKSEPVPACGLEEHVHGDACYASAETVWDCQAPVPANSPIQEPQVSAGGDDPDAESQGDIEQGGSMIVDGPAVLPEDVAAFLDAMESLPEVTAETAAWAEAIMYDELVGNGYGYAQYGLEEGLDWAAANAERLTAACAVYENAFYALMALAEESGKDVPEAYASADFPVDVAFKNPIIDGQDIYDGSTKIWIAVLTDGETRLPGEPGITLDRTFSRIGWQYDVRDDNQDFSHNPLTFFNKEAILTSPDFVKNTDGKNVWGISDPTGAKVKAVIRGADWGRIYDALHAAGKVPGPKDQYTLVPYVVKYQGQGEYDPGWHIDCAIVPVERIQISYVLNLPDGISTPGHTLGVPGGSYSTDSPYFVPVGCLKDNDADQGANYTVNGATYNGSPANLTFLGWSTSPDATEADDKFAPNATVELTETTILYGVWSWEGKTHDISYTVEYYKDDDTEPFASVPVTETVNPDVKTVTVNSVEDKAPEGEGYVRDTAKSTTLPAEVSDGDVIKVYYAKAVTVTYDPQHGSFTDIPEAATWNGETAEFTCPTGGNLPQVSRPTADNAEFVGWAPAESDTLKVGETFLPKDEVLTEEQLETATVEKDAKLVAVWSSSIDVYIVERDGTTITRSGTLNITRAEEGQTTDKGFSAVWDGDKNCYQVNFQFANGNMVDIDLGIITDDVPLGFYCATNGSEATSVQAHNTGWMLAGVPGKTEVYVVLDRGYTVRYEVDDKDSVTAGTPTDDRIYFTGEAPKEVDPEKGTFFKNTTLTAVYGELTLAVLPTVKDENSGDYSVTGWMDENDAIREPGKVTLDETTLTGLDRNGDRVITLKAKVEKKQPELSVTKTAKDTDGNELDADNGVTVGDKITYIITVTNSGSKAAKNVTLEDNVPMGLTIESVTVSDGTEISPVGNKVEGTISVPAKSGEVNGEVTVTIVAEVTHDAVAKGDDGKYSGTGSAKNTVTVKANPDDPGKTDETPNIPVTGKPELKVTKTNGLANNTVEVGAEFTYTIKVENNGSATAETVTIEDTQIQNAANSKLVEIVSVKLNDGKDLKETFNGTVTVDGLAAGATATLEITVKAIAKGTVKNTAVAKIGDEEPGVSSEETKTEITGEAALKVEKTVRLPEGKAAVEVGDEVVYTIKVTNEGNVSADPFTVKDTLPKGLELVSADVDQDSETLVVENSFEKDTDENNVSVKVKSLAPKKAQTFTLTITAKVTDEVYEELGEDSTVYNTAFAGASSNKENPTPIKVAPKLTIAKSADVTTVEVGKTITYTITVKNEGKATANNVLITDEVPAALGEVKAFDGETELSNTVNGNTVSYNVGRLAADESVTLTITAVAKTVGEAKNIATVNSDETTEVRSPEVPGTVTGKSALKVEKTANVEKDVPVKVGDEITYTVKVWNEGSVKAENVVIEDTLTGLSLVADSITGVDSSKVTLNGKTIRIDYGDLLPTTKENAVTLTYKTTVDDLAEGETAGTANNKVTVKGTDDSGDEGEIPSKVNKPNLTIEKTVDKAYAKTGDELTYTIKVKNDGTADATNVVITDTLPEGLELVSATLNGTKLESYSGTVPVGNLAAKDEETGETGEVELTIKAKVTAKAAEGEEPVRIMNTAVVSSDDPVEPKNPKAEVTTTVADPKVTITKEADKAQVKLGEIITYTITVTNSGEVEANNVVVTDELDPAYLEYVSATLDDKPLEEYDGSVTISAVPAAKGDEAGKAVLVIKAKAIKVGTAKNIATVKDGENPEIPSSEVETEVNGLKVTKSLNANRLVESSIIYLNGSITYTITVENTTDEAATNVVLRDVLDSNVRFSSCRIGNDSAMGTQPSNGEYALGSIPAGGSVKVTIIVNATRDAVVGTMIYNRASAVCTEMDTNSYSNRAVTEVVRRPSVPSDGGGGSTPTPPTPPSGGGGGGGSTPTPTQTPTETITDDSVPLAAAPGLNSTDHFAYIIGYEDNTVRPTNNITRAEVATIFFRLMTDEFRSQNWSTTNSFPDVEEGKWYNNAVSTTVQAGLVKGYTDGTFKPTNNITRAEFAAIAARFLSDDAATAAPFSDTVGHWAEQDIARAVQAGWLKGYSDGSFQPNAYITRAEVMTAVNRMLDRTPDKDHMLPDMVVWADNPETAWYYEDVQEATNGHDYERDEMGIMEIWTALQAVRDWAALEAEWANANS